MRGVVVDLVWVGGGGCVCVWLDLGGSKMI